MLGGLELIILSIVFIFIIILYRIFRTKRKKTIAAAAEEGALAPPPEELTCTACGAVIPSGEATCPACGAPAPPPAEAAPPVEQPCTACGAMIPAGSLTCPACGAPAPPPAEMVPEVITCVTCGQVIPPGSATCPACGAPTPATPPPAEVICTACGAVIPAGAATCPACGAPATPPQPEAVPPPAYPPERAPRPEPKPLLAKPSEAISFQAVVVKSAINCEHAKVIYKVKIENNSNSSMSEVCIKPFIPKDIFILDQPEKTVSLIKKGESKTITFTLRPKGECGNVDISGKVSYYDTRLEEYKELKIEPKSTQIICPMLRIKQIDENQWRENTSQLISVQETIEDIPISMEELFDIISDVIKDMNMYMLESKIGTRRSLGKLYSEGVKGFKYGVQIEVIGGLQNSKLIIKAFAENQECLIGFYHKILDEIEERTNIKKYIKDLLIIKGDYMPGGQKIEIKDSVIQRSKIGTEIENKKELDIGWE